MKSIFNQRSATPLLQAVNSSDDSQSDADDRLNDSSDSDATTGSNGRSPVASEYSGLDARSDINFDSLVDASTQHPAIEAALATMQTLKAFVTPEGAVYYVEDPARTRIFEQLLELVRRELGRANPIPISIMAFSKLRSQVVRSRRESTSHNDLVEMVLHDAIARKSSDIYIAVHTDRTQIHFRTHGVRYLHSEISRTDGHEMARALWSLARQGQYEENATTDTAFSFGGYRVRANSMRDTRGNSIVLRLRDPKFIPPLAELGYSGPQQCLIDELQWSAGGLAVISGETNSGKSTTLTSLMAGMPDSEMIIEIADPIEIEFDHVTHVEFDHYAEAAESRFRGILGGLVRQNPDTLFIGEIRDLRSATAAIDMSLQGKRVWGTVHSHACLTTIARLEHLGIDVNLLAQPGFLNGVINQSLVPVVCEKCCSDTLPDEEITSRLREKYQSDGLRFHHRDGCGDCVRGISGQTVVAEVMAFPRDASHPARRFIRDHDLAGLAGCMREEGMLSKATHAVSKIRQGLLDPILTEEAIGRIGTSDALPDDVSLQTSFTSRRSEQPEGS
ncbi:MAG: ATPase, T2SS/T4P/T4SS family [Gammaproteobacteria bacterium]|nr:ATPase, T2SS/T4P/T4SS family [Gammaproteobacteria bacterium]